jgi:hypothetical protein
MNPIVSALPDNKEKRPWIKTEFDIDEGKRWSERQDLNRVGCFAGFREFSLTFTNTTRYTISH